MYNTKIKKECIIMFILFLFLSSIVFADISEVDKQDVLDQITLIEVSVNDGSTIDIVDIIFPNAHPGLGTEIMDAIANQPIYFKQDITSIRQKDGKIKVETTFLAEGDNWNTNGLSNYYIFEEQDGKWLLLDTNFHEKITEKQVFYLVGIIFAIIGVILIPMFVFWVWMLIDLLRRDFDSKIVWLILMIFTGIIGSVLYYFLVRRKKK